MSEKILCLAAYIFSLPGVILARFAGKKRSFCLHHARRSAELFLFMLFLFALWFAVTYILLLIPYLGFPVAMALFGIVVTAFIFCVVLCVMGIAKALRGETVVFPFVTSFMSKIDPFLRIVGLPDEQE
jgi:uncharacterized membrane protein